MKGRKPKHLALKILQGNPGGRPLEGSGDPFTVGMPEKPTGLEKFADEEWDRLTTHLAPILCHASRGMLLVCADAYAQMMTANAVLQKKGLTYTTTTESGSIMIRQRPEVRMKENA
jgi:phage terminase small subunit